MCVDTVLQYNRKLLSILIRSESQVASLVHRPQRGGGAAAATDARIAAADVCSRDPPAQIAAALQAWHEAAGTRSPPPERTSHTHDSASERERQRCAFAALRNRG